MSRVRVLHVITHLGFGGGLDNTLLTVKGHSRDRYEVHLAAGPSPEGYEDWELRARECSDALFVVPSLCRPVHPSRDFRAMTELSRLMREREYQIVHTHCAKAGVLGRIAARREKVPVVVHTYHTFGWQVANAPARSTLGRLASSARKRLYVLLERYAASLSDGLITVSELNRREAIALNLAPADKLTTIYSGIDLDCFTVRSSKEEICRRLGVEPGRPIVGSIGRLSVQKSPLDFVRAAKMVLERRPEVQFLLVGNGPLAHEVERAIGSEPRIRMLGYRADVPEILSVLDAFVLSSLWEGLGRALTEAMAAGVPAAVTAVDGVPELAVHGETGLLSPAGDPALLADNIVRILVDPASARSMAERAMRRVVPVFGAQRMVERIETFYAQLLDRKAAPATAREGATAPRDRDTADAKANSTPREDPGAARHDDAG